MQRDGDRLGVAKYEARKSRLERMTVADHNGRKRQEAFTGRDVFRKHRRAADGEEGAAKAAQHAADQNGDELILCRVDADGLRRYLFDAHAAKPQSERRFKHDDIGDEHENKAQID